MAFDYFYGLQSDQFSFYRIPKVLFTDEQFRTVSTDAKTLYGILLDRMNLSARNGWLDECGRVYIIFTVDEVMESLGCARQKAAKLFEELEEKCGLIERKRQGLGKPNMIYVKNFIRGSLESNFKKYENQTSGSMKIIPQEVRKSNGNNTDINDTDYSDTNPFLSDESREENEAMSERCNYRNYFLEQLEYDRLQSEHPYDGDLLEEILELLIDTVCSKRKIFRIAGDDKPVEVVKSRLMKLGYEHISYVLEGMKENTTRIRNMKQYLLAALYNAPLTIGHHYSSLVNHDMANGLI